MSETNSYHGQAVIKEPIWTWEIPMYFFTGGLGGASAGLAFLSGARGNEVLARRAWAASAAGISVSPLFLISDLGKPTRFMNMFRMFKVTSPMSVGSWILGASGAATTLAAADAWTGMFPRSARVARPAAALLGLPLSTYTAALVANTAVPVWHEARRMLPFVFGSGAALSAGAAALIATPPEHAGPARRLALASAALELGANEIMKKRLAEHGEPYKHGLPSHLSHLSQAMLIGGAALLARRGSGSRVSSAAAGALMGAGALAARWTVFKAGFASAADPKYVVGPQRGLIERGERRGASRQSPNVREVRPAQGSPATAPVELSTP
ncbi:MAG: NrfD/PsrC family molybdoenzyme membrane anchor subunit [Solirubrobacteraceae bacterium]